MFTFSPEQGLWGLFASAFISATILPGSSEFVLVGLITKYPDTVWNAVAVATVGNTFGGLTSYWLGRLFPNKVESRALAWVRRYGAWSLLLSWVPLIGDALCIAAGWQRFNVWLCTLSMAIGKLFRYVMIAGGWAWFATTFLK